MNRLLSSRGLLERTSVARQVRSIHLVSSHTSTFRQTRLGPSRHLQSYPPILFAPIRSFASSPPPTAKSAELEKDDQPPPVAPVHGHKPKHKVELRPGPAKPVPSTAKPSLPKALQTSTEHIQSHAPQQQQPTPTVKEPSSIIEITKNDIAAAAKHGILAPPPEGAGWVQRFYHQAKELLKFYWGGLKLIHAHRKDVLKIEARVKSGGAPISRWENRFIITYKSDRLKLVPFVLICLVLEEIIPLIVIYAPGLLPSTCVLPSQRERIESKRHEKQKQALTHRDQFTALAQAQDQHISAVKFLDASVVVALCRLLGLSDRGFPMQTSRRLFNYLHTIAEDDRLLLKENKGSQLSHVEVVEALWERGLIAEQYSQSEQRKLLALWLNLVSSQSVSVSNPDHSPEVIRLGLLARMVN